MKIPIHAIISNKLKEFGLKQLLRVSMVYTKQKDLAGLLKSDALLKVNAGRIDLNYEDRMCNCQGRKEKGCLLKDGNCRTNCCIYQIKCKLGKCKCNTYYGATARFAKDRISEHISDLKRIIKKDQTPIDSFTRHFLRHNSIWYKNDYPEMSEIKQVIECKVRKRIKPLGLGTENCSICCWERYIIVTSDDAMNNREEIYSACKHRAKLIRPSKI